MANTSTDPTLSATVHPVVRPVKVGPRQPLQLVGRPGGAFAIDGDGFSDAGTLMVGGRVVETTSWRDTSVRGLLPTGLPVGKVSLKPHVGDEQNGDYPYVPSAPVKA